MIIENLGKVLPIARGAYSASAQYNRLDIVYDADSGSSYIYKSDTPTTGTPLSNGNYWQIFADVRAAVSKANTAAQNADAATQWAKDVATQAEAILAQMNSVISEARTVITDTNAAKQGALNAADGANVARDGANVARDGANVAAGKAEVSAGKAEKAAGDADAAALELRKSVDTAVAGMQTTTGTAVSEMQTKTGAAIATMQEATGAAVKEALEATGEARVAAQGAIDAKDDLSATALRTSASRWDFHVGGNSVVANPAAGGIMQVVADKDCTVIRSGKNMFSSALELGSLSNTSGVNSTSTDNVRTKDYIPVLPGTTLTLTNDMNYAAYRYFYDRSKAFISYEAGGNNLPKVTFVIPKNAYYMRVRSVATQIQNSLDVKYQLEAGSIATPFVPFVAFDTYPLTANTPTEIKAIQGENHLFADNDAWLKVGFNRDTMDVYEKDLTVPVSTTEPVAEIDGCIGGRPLDVTVRAVASGGGGTPDAPIPIMGHSVVNVTVNGHTYPVPVSEPLYGLAGLYDEADIRRGIITRRTQRRQFDGTESWTLYSSQPTDTNIARFQLSNSGMAGSAIGLCNRFPWKISVGNNAVGDSIGGGASGDTLYLYIQKSRMSGWSDQWTAEQKNAAMKGWLAERFTAGEPVEIVYQLAIPAVSYFDPITIHSLPGLNTVYSDAGGDTTVTGRMGLRGVMNLITSQQTQITELQKLTTNPTQPTQQ